MDRKTLDRTDSLHVHLNTEFFFAAMSGDDIATHFPCLNPQLFPYVGKANNFSFSEKF